MDRPAIFDALLYSMTEVLLHGKLRRNKNINNVYISANWTVKYTLSKIYFGKIYDAKNDLLF